MATFPLGDFGLGEKVQSVKDWWKANITYHYLTVIYRWYGIL